MGFHVGKYPVRPMDPSWEMAIHLSTVFFPATMLMEKSLPWPRPHDQVWTTVWGRSQGVAVVREYLGYLLYRHRDGFYPP